jgi:putative transposase
MARGCLYRVAMLDLASRTVLAWRRSNTRTADCCVTALEEALAQSGTPDIFNTDQGAQFTRALWISMLKNAGAHISMDGKGRWVDHGFIERLWRSVKYEEVYLHAYETPHEAEMALKRYFAFYNAERPHQVLANQTPDAVSYGQLADHVTIAA